MSIEYHRYSSTGKSIESKTSVPKAPLAHTYGSSLIIAHSIYQKYDLKVPAYPQENDWQKLGLSIQRQDLINWQMKCSEYYFKLLYDLLRERLLKRKIFHVDELSYWVLESETIKTYYIDIPIR